MKVKELIKLLKKRNPEATIRFSIADDSSEDPGERWFCEDGIEDMFDDGRDDAICSATEVTICLVGVSNLKAAE